MPSVWSHINKRSRIFEVTGKAGLGLLPWLDRWICQCSIFKLCPCEALTDAPRLEDFESDSPTPPWLQFPSLRGLNQLPPTYLSGKACLPRLTFSDPYSNGQQRSWKYLTLRLWSFNSGHITPGITSTWGPRLFVWPLNVWEFDILEMLDSSRQRLLKQNKNSLFLCLSFQSNNIAWFIEQVLITFQLWLHHLKRIKGMQRNSGHDTRPVLMLPNLLLFVFLFYKRGNRGQKQ